MEFLDTASNPRIPLLLELLSSLSRIKDPAALLEQFIRTMRRAYGAHCYIQLSTAGLPAGQYRFLRFMAPDGAEHCPPGDTKVHSGGFLGRVIATPTPKAAHDLRLEDDAALGDMLAPYRSMAAVPVVDNPFGIDWAVVLDPEPQRLGLKDIEELLVRVALLGTGVNNLEIARQLAKANAHIQAEIEQIARIQQTLLPDPLPEIPGLSIAASYKTFERAGGDYYDFFPLPVGRWGILIADASGHGPAAAVVMAMLHAILHATSRSLHTPAALMQHLNRQLCAKRIESSFVTAFLAFYEPGTHKLSFARAGHPPPLLRTADAGEPFKVLNAANGIPLGIEPDFEFSYAELALMPGQTLVLYTDGISEAPSATGEFFDVPGIQAAMTNCPADPQGIVTAIANAVSRHQGKLQPRDDHTIVAVHVLSGTGGSPVISTQSPSP